MANKLALGLVIGGAVSSTVGAAFKDVTGRIKRLEAEGNKARVLQRTIGDTIRLREEWKKAHDTGAAGASKLLSRLNSNLDSLKKQGVEVGRLEKAYRSMGQTANKAELKAKGHQQIDSGVKGMKGAVGAAVVGVGAMAVPAKVSADFGAIVRDIAIKAGIANKPQEQEMSRKIIDTSRDTGMARNDVADVVNQLVGAGMDLSKALEYAPVAAKFVVGQGSSGVDTAKMINALGQNAKITDPKQMQQALEAIAYQGQAGSFEAADMAKWFPELLANMASNGITGLDAVTQLGAMLQVQMKQAGSSDEAANNLKNWMGKIGSTDTVKAYEKAGIDYKGSMQTGLQNGMSTLETSMALAQKYIQATDPKRAAAMAEATSKISKEANPEKAKAMMASLEESLRTGDLFADMQVKAALSAYMQNKALYSQLKNDSREATGILDKNLAERRESSSQKWAEMAQSMDDAMRSIGDALRPVTDVVAESLTKVTKGITSLTDSAPGVVAGIATVGAGLIALKGIFNTIKISKGMLNLARGARGGRNGSEAPNKNPGELDLVATGLDVVSRVKEAAAGGGLGAESGSGNDGVKKVFVVNAGAMGGGVDASGESRRRGRGSRRSARRRSLPSSRGPRPSVPRPPVSIPSPSVPSVQSGALSKLGVVAGTVGKVGKAAKVIPGGTLLESGAMAFETFQNAKTKDEKAEGYGSAAGNLAGTMAGAAAGAAIGSVVPIIGTAIGGMIGAYLGSQGGAALGGSLGKSLFGGEDEKLEQTAKAPVPSTPLMMASAAQQGPVLGDVARSMAVTAPLKSAALAIQPKEPAKAEPTKVDQQFQYSLSMPVTVQGDVKDLQTLAQDLMPHMQRMMADAARSNAAKLYDEPHV
ncbi:TP901 family phage tail tape measure protein [Pseudomonas baetica]|uniref:TP901 family phage tail tape measure protein n=1 Tax=Pseudomonas baetica TaxID=674054 RepID=A0ABX4Q440_9PSED|nr:phage tail tape measure protein [Pseudomonas baetica]PKA71558.1 TP901 family phage tail tape measure protein [Pseudomonas baetica]PTC20041.1 phage tail tape measure protein [Pseudomonas baetica]